MVGQSNEQQGVWFVYDGDCPICTYAAHALHIKDKFGSLHTLDARSVDNPSLLKTINEMGFDLDEGMVIFHQGKFYHGATALVFMAKHGAPKGGFNIVNRLLFSNELIAKAIYPSMRFIRNLSIKIRRRSKIDNLTNKLDPTFKTVFGSDWDNLPPIMKKHYANRPYSDDHARVEGELDIHCHSLMRLMSPVMRMIGGVPPVNETKVHVSVDFKSDPKDKSFYFDRMFHFKEHRPYRFHSRMLPVGGNQMVEIMGLGVGWKSSFHWSEDKVILKHAGYCLYLFGTFIPLPITWLVGEGYAEEIPIDDDTFEMFVEIKHPLWGNIYGYNGWFKVTKEI